MKLLAIETTAEACSVALAHGEDCIERMVHGTRHSERILGMVEEVLAEAQLRLNALDAIAFSRGPGSFTSLRIGAGVVQGLAFGADLAVVPVSSLAVLAQGVAAERVMAALDARMQQVYWAALERDARGVMKAVSGETVCDPARAPMPAGEDWVGAGSGWDVYGDVLAARLGGRIASIARGMFPRARDLAVLGAASLAGGGARPAEDALPVYVRDEVAAKARRR